MIYRHTHNVTLIFHNMSVSLSVVLVAIRESVDSLCRDGADRTHPFSKIEWVRTPKRGSYKPF